MEQPFTIASVSGTNNWPSRESFRPKEHKRNEEEVDHGDGGGKSLPVRKSHEDKRYHRRLLLRGRNFGANDVCERDTTAVFTSPAETFDHFESIRLLRPNGRQTGKMARRDKRSKTLSTTFRIHGFTTTFECTTSNGSTIALAEP